VEWKLSKRVLGYKKLRKIIMRCKKLYTVKQWKKFKKTKATEFDGIKHYFDLQELMCKKYDIILTDHKTKWEQILSILKKINTKNLNKCIDTFSMGVQAFVDFIDELSKDLESSKKVESDKDEINLEKLWGKSQTNIKIWPDYPKNQSEYQRSKDEINLEKLWGKRK
jgi:hypothetical protein